MEKSTTLIRLIMFLIVVVTFYFYYPFAYHTFLAIIQGDWWNSNHGLIASTETTLTEDNGLTFAFINNILIILLFVVCFFALPGGLLVSIWHISKKLASRSNGQNRSRRGGHSKKDRTIAGFDEKLLLNAYNQLQHIEAAIDTKLTNIKEDIVTELREEIRNMFDRKAEAEQCLGKARTLYKSGQYEEALGECNSAVELSPSGVAHYIRGVIHHKLSLDEAAMDDLKTAAKLGYQKAQDFLTVKGASY